ncbi:H-NS histone family protein [Paracoccus aminophilus]|uniref:Histone family protein nucleoid-structuring protein H-NS n=1 Tax=Paracoccus aminophilus JCM 7686 TaxID=1367847 RepID=S5YZ26_PARAH|nr:H-NS histone family protein [Paracoccus aminophilus]AGT10461.1 histone family protein nucleoid-structuring protein H-NS [Paracoccus aminophilus JCM 7686]
MSVDLDAMNLSELRDLRNKVERAINSYEDRRRKEALAAVEVAAREHGFNLAELTGIKISKSRVAAKYVNPADQNQTWSGRGRKPRWVQEHLDSGKSVEDLAI